MPCAGKDIVRNTTGRSNAQPRQNLADDTLITVSRDNAEQQP